MKAIVFTEYGPPEVLRIGNIPVPLPAAGEILVKIRATALNFGDLVVRNFRTVTPRKFHMPLLFWIVGRISFGLRKPRNRVLGSEFAGEVLAVGPKVTRFKAGDRVFGFRGPKMGAYAEYLCLPETGVVAEMPANLDFPEAACLPYGAMMALSLLETLKPRPGQKLLVVGASGGIGPAVVQLAKAHYHLDVSGVCGTARAGYVAALGADRVIDYSKEDFTASGEAYDFIVDILGKTPFSRSRRVLRPGGRCLLVSFKMKQVFQMLWTAWFSNQKLVCFLSSETLEKLHRIKNLVEAEILRPIIDRCFPLEQAAEAHRYWESGQRTGAVVLVQPGSPS